MKKTSLILALMFVLANFLSYIKPNAASKPVIPQIKFVHAPTTEYTAGDRVKFDIYAPNYSGKVEYRVVLWEDAKKSYRDLWTPANGFSTRYYTKWRPSGKSTFTLGWNITEPGSYRITVYVKRVGIAPSKAYLGKFNCDSYMQSVAFKVKPKMLALDKEGMTYGSADPNNLQAVNTNIGIKAKDITYNNAYIYGDVYLSADNITLKNLYISGTLFIDPGIDSSFNLDNVRANKIDIKTLKDDIYEFKNITTGTLIINTKKHMSFKAGKGSLIQNTIINENTDIENGEGSFGNVYLVGNTTNPVTVNAKGNFEKPIVIEKSAILKSDKNWLYVRISPLNNKNITATLDGWFGNVNIQGDSTVKINSNSLIRTLSSYANASVYADESSTIDSIKSDTDIFSLFIYGKVKYNDADGAVFVSDSSVLPTGSDIGGNIKAQLYYSIEESDLNYGVKPEPVLRMKLLKADGSPLNITRCGKFFIDNGKEVQSFKYYDGDVYTLPVNKDDGTIRIPGGNYKFYVPAEINKWYVLSFTAKQLSTTGIHRSEITSVNGVPYKFTRWATPKYSILSNGTNKTYITIGSTLNDVLRVLGKAASSIGDKEDYDLIYFYPKDRLAMASVADNYIQLVIVNGTYTVAGWKNNGAMNVKLETAITTAPPFKIGSSMEEVARAMGTPGVIDHYYDADEWIYKGSHVYFVDGRVVQWENTGNLKVDMGKKDLAAPPFKFGSTMQEVIKAMGTPTKVDESSWASRGSIWAYGESIVTFSPITGLVKFWENHGNLNVSMGKIDPEASPFTLGSSMEDVAKANGTPKTLVTETDGSFTWYYPDLNYYSCIVKFDKDGKVNGWSNPGNLKVWLGDKDPSAIEPKVGSAKEDVIKYLGTPRKIDGDTWDYGSKSYNIRFDKEDKIYYISLNN